MNKNRDNSLIESDKGVSKNDNISKIKKSINKKIRGKYKNKTIKDKFQKSIQYIIIKEGIKKLGIFFVFI